MLINIIITIRFLFSFFGVIQVGRIGTKLGRSFARTFCRTVFAMCDVENAGFSVSVIV